MLNLSTTHAFSLTRVVVAFAMTDALDVEQATAALARGDVVVAESQRAAFLRVGACTLMLPRGAITRQVCNAPYLFVVNEYAVARVLSGHTPLRAAQRSPQVTAVLAPAEELLEKNSLLDTVVGELRAGRRFVGGATTDTTWTVEWNGSAFVKRAPDEEGNVHVTDLSEAEVRETMALFSVCGLDRLRPGAVIDERQEVVVALV